MRAAVVGRPVAHSLSPLLHRAAYAALGLDDWTYDLLDLGAEDLPVLIAGLGEETSDALVASGLVKTVADLYALTEEQLLKVPRMGKKSA